MLSLRKISIIAAGFMLSGTFLFSPFAVQAQDVSGAVSVPSVETGPIGNPLVQAVPGPGTPVADSGNFLRNTVSALEALLNQANTAITAVTSKFQLLKGTTLDPLAWAVAQAALQSIVNGTVKWVNSGFNGSPAFVTNLNTLLQQVGDTQANLFIGQLNSNSAIKSPFQSQVASAVSTNYFRSTGANGFFNSNPFTLGQASPNPTAFLAGGTSGFAQGGWNAWLSTAMNSANNPYGAALLASQALGGQVANAQSIQKTEAGWGSGFASYRGNCQTTTTGAVSAVPVVNSGPVQSITNNLDTNLAAPVTDAGLVPAGQSTPTAAASAAAPTGGGLSSTFTLQQEEANGAPTSLSGNSGCQSQNIVTPGATIANSLYKSLGSGIDSLVSVHQFDEIVNALLSQLIGKVLSPSGLAGSQSTASAATTATTPASGTTSSVNTTLSTSFAQTLSGQLAGLQSFQSSWNIIDQAALAAQSALQTSSCPENQATLVDTVQPVLDEATTELANASSSIAAITNIQNELPPANSTTDETAQLAQVSSDYSALLASPTLPSDSDITNAGLQSSDSTNTGLQTSLYTEMIQIAQQASTCTTGVVPVTIQNGNP